MYTGKKKKKHRGGLRIASVKSLRLCWSFFTRLLVCLLSFMLFLLQELITFIRSYVVPEGFPDSVTPSYVPYMSWRALKVLCSALYIMVTTLEMVYQIQPPQYGDSDVLVVALLWWSHGCFHYTNPPKLTWSFQR